MSSTQGKGGCKPKIWKEIEDLPSYVLLWAGFGCDDGLKVLLLALLSHETAVGIGRTARRRSHGWLLAFRWLASIHLGCMTSVSLLGESSQSPAPRLDVQACSIGCFNWMRPPIGSIRAQS